MNIFYCTKVGITIKKYVNYYTKRKYKVNNDELYYEYNDGYLYSNGIYKTKIKEEDLPQYFVKGTRYHNYYVKATDVKYLVYKPNYSINHFLKDDLVFISYDKL